jgi:hypothetical protein
MYCVLYTMYFTLCVLCVQCVVTPRPSFLDFIRGGCSLNFVVAVDFTASNKPPKFGSEHTQQTHTHTQHTHTLTRA